LVIVIVVTAAGTPGQTTRATATIKDVAWLEGTWVSASGQRTVEERWTSPAGGIMFAVSRTLAGNALPNSSISVSSNAMEASITSPSRTVSRPLSPRRRR
jgi:hypothetical protein